MCGLSLLAIFTFWVFTLWHTTLVLYSKRKSSITASAPLTTKLISKQARLNATKSVLVTLIAEADRVLCQLVMFLTAFFYWVYKKWNSAVIKSLLLFVASLFNGFLVEKYVACQSRKSHLRSHRFRFSPCLMRKRVEKSEAILALLNSFQGAASWMVSLSNYCIWCLFFISNLMKSSLVYAAI